MSVPSHVRWRMTRRPRSRCSATISCSTIWPPTHTSTHRASKRSSRPGCSMRLAPAARPSGDGLEVVARLVTVSDDDQLNDGTKRGVAASMLTYFPLLAPQLDVRIPVVVPYGTDPDDTVEIGSYCDVQRLFGQLLTDAPAQLVLGAMTERYRVAATAGLAGAIAARPRRRRRRAPGPDRGRARRRQCRRRAGVALARGANLPRRVRARPRHRTREGADLVGDRDQLRSSSRHRTRCSLRSRSPPRSSPPRSIWSSRRGWATSEAPPHPRSASP